MNIGSLNRLFLFIMTLALGLNVAAMEPVKGLISKAAAAKPSQKKAPTAQTNDEEKKNKIIEGKNRPTEFQKRGKSHISTGMARIICDGNFMYDTNDTYFEKVTFIGSKFYPAIFDTLNINDTWRGIKPVALIANSYKQCDFTKADMRNIEISKCYFELSNFSEANLSSAELAKADSENCKLDDFKGRDRAKITSSTFHSCDFIGADLNSVIFKDVKFFNVNFESSNLKHVIFDHCFLIEVKFSETVGGYVQFNNCVINKLTFDLADFTSSLFLHCFCKPDNWSIYLTNFIDSVFSSDDFYKSFKAKGALIDPMDKERILPQIAQEKEKRRVLKLKQTEEQPAQESKEIIEQTEVTQTEITQGGSVVLRQRSKVVTKPNRVKVGNQPANTLEITANPNSLNDGINGQQQTVTVENQSSFNLNVLPENPNYGQAPLYISPQPYQEHYPYNQNVATTPNYVPSPAPNGPQPYQEHYPYNQNVATTPNYVPSPAPNGPQPYQEHYPYNQNAAAIPNYAPSPAYNGPQPCQGNYPYNQNVPANPNYAPANPNYGQAQFNYVAPTNPGYSQPYNGYQS